MKNAFAKYEFDLYSEAQLEKWLSGSGLSLQNPKALADAIVALSDVYNGAKGSPQIWDRPQFVAAYLCYFMPLNYLRCRYVLSQTPIIEGSHFVDYGAGIGAFTFALSRHLHALGSPAPTITAVEPNSHARQWLERLAKEIAVDLPLTKLETKAAADKKTEGRTFLFSYSLNEMAQLPPLASDADALIIVEPSLRDTARRLQELRAPLIDQGFHILAPCLHADGCPLLLHTKTDWCHTRFHIEMPKWFRAIEAHLPMKNQSLTLSYLAVAKAPASERTENDFRVIGDTLFERGKTKQAVCRSEKREFLTWLTRHGEAPVIDRGTLIRVTSPTKIVSNEVRADGPFEFVYLDAIEESP